MQASAPDIWQRKNWLGKLLGLGIAVAGLFLLNLSLGSVAIPPGQVAKILLGLEAGQEAWHHIIWEFRLPKALTALLAGSALACSGLQMQTLFRNPLAGPFVLGISSGASLGVALVVMAGSLLGGWLLADVQGLIILAATIGSASVLLLVVLVSMKVRDGMTLLIIGLMFGSLASAVVSILQFFSEAEQIQAYLIWTFGSLGGTTREELRLLLPIVLAGLLLAQFLAKPLNALLLGERYAESMGVSLKKSRFLIILSTSLLAGSVTAYCGPIAFVGLAVPHLSRLLFPTADHRKLLPAVMFGGAILLLACDILAQLPGSEKVLPINAVTSLLGAPVVIWLIVRRRNISKSF
ncbi:FecCD family ABC transporter permease [Nafulsella turpanensis]|uniref:FecCD family ABC transporter permease n=1 Tax=Nafulsella turpanensis TaxID=1265690 RepID=UPI00034A331B|nr:iron ABC transporter permease [Nafulsella turpanensis]